MTPKEWGELPPEDRLFLERASLEEAERRNEEADV